VIHSVSLGSNHLHATRPIDACLFVISSTVCGLSFTKDLSDLGIMPAASASPWRLAWPVLPRERSWTCRTPSWSADRRDGQKILEFVELEWISVAGFPQDKRPVVTASYCRCGKRIYTIPCSAGATQEIIVRCGSQKSSNLPGFGARPAPRRM